MYSYATNQHNHMIQSNSPTSLIDNQGRKITYLRLAITDKCNLRCHYCMPEKGLSPIPEDKTLSYQELDRVVSLFEAMGITKVRITGGEPLVRENCIDFIDRIKHKIGINQVCITTNGVVLEQHLERLKKIGIATINMSLDTLHPGRFKDITGRDHLPRVLSSLDRALELNIPLKINSVVCENTSDNDIAALGDLATRFPISLRFIEKMPFSGVEENDPIQTSSLRERICRIFPNLKECSSDIISTAHLFSSPDLIGTIGLIEGYSRKFCSTCNKVRITPQGILKTCLYDNGVLDLKPLLRSGLTNEEISLKIQASVSRRYVDGHATEQLETRVNRPSMATIGG